MTIFNELESNYPFFWASNPISGTQLTDTLFKKLSFEEIQEVHKVVRKDDEISYERLIQNEKQGGWRYKREILTLGAHYCSDWFFEKTGISSANPPKDVPSMTRLEIFAGDFYAGDVLLDSLEECGEVIKEGGKYLDFGCSSARVLRNLCAAYPNSEWYGCDPQKKAIDWATNTFSKLRLEHTSEDPPLPYEENSFDGGFAFSVWSHLSRVTA